MVLCGRRVSRVLLSVAVCSLALAGPTLALPPVAVADPFTPLVGVLHAHSGYSDGWPGSRPQTYFDSARAFGNDFLGSSEHSDNADIPFVLNEECLNPLVAPDCAIADKVEPANSFRKWDATLEQADAASSPTFTGFRGFEWSSDRFGHINVFFSRNDLNAYAEGGFISMESFWSWLHRPASAGGGSDGIATFNHPGGKSLNASDPAFNWNDFAYVPAADERMVGIEVFNDRKEYGDPGKGGPYPEGSYAHALDKGWHVGAIGAEDLGHRRTDDWGGPSWAKTVVLAAGNSRQALEQALLARRFYAVRTPQVRLDFTLDGRPMGSRTSPTTGAPLAIAASVNDPAAQLELVTSRGTIVASGQGQLNATRAATSAERYYFVRARRDGQPIAYSSPVWVAARPPASAPTTGEWLAGDLHVHTCFSHDAYCPPGDDNTGPDEFYTASLGIGGRFAEASARGLDFLAITDHNDVRSSADPDFGSFGVLGLPAYENSLHGHAQMLGAERIYDKGDSSAAAVSAMADALRADGGVFQANHPADGVDQPFDSCDDTGLLDWTYGYDVRPDTVEVWNVTSPTSISAAYWECWLQRGERIGATGGSDSHWAWTTPVQGAGNPTTWVLAREHSREGILEAIRAGRTTISRVPPGQGGAPFLLEADVNYDGNYESVIGDTVPPDTLMRVRAPGLPVTGFVRIRANGQTLFDETPLLPDRTFSFRAPDEPGWVRAELTTASTATQAAPGCDPPTGEAVTTCAYDHLMLGMTSPIYLGGG